MQIMNHATLALLAIGFVAGCSDRPTMLPNSDAELNKPATILAAEALKRFPYPANLAKGTAPLPVRAEVDYGTNELRLVNYGDESWSAADVWVNQKYVVPLSTLESKKVKKIAFEVLFDGMGRHFPRNGVRIETVELRMGEELHPVTVQLGE